GTTTLACAPWPAACRAPRRTACCPVPSPPECILPAPICVPFRGSPWPRPESRNRSTWHFLKLPFLMLGRVKWNISGSCLLQRQTKFEPTIVIPRACGISSTPRRLLLTAALVFTGSSAFADDDVRV